MKISYTAHLKFRLKVRGIPSHLPKQIYKEAEEHYYDTLTRHYIAVRKLRFINKLREVAVTYDKKGKTIEIVTIHPLKNYQKIARINSGRWRRI